MDNEFWNDETVEDCFRQFCLENGGSFKQFMQTYKASKQPVKDYEILVFRSNNHKHTYWDLQSNKTYTHRSNGGVFDEEDLLTGLDGGLSVRSGHISIHSVRRKSDLEVFSIGDKVNGVTVRNVTINGFNIYDDKIIIDQTAGEIKLEDAEKVKQPILTLADIESCTQRVEFNGYSIGFLNEDKLKELAKQKLNQ